jgi:hypothetical protein
MQMSARSPLAEILHATGRRDYAKRRAVSSDGRGSIEIDKHALFCIRLHFVLKERIGVEKISAKRFLTIGESAPLRLRRRQGSSRRREFRHAREHDDNLAARFASKAVA